MPARTRRFRTILLSTLTAALALTAALPISGATRNPRTRLLGAGLRMRRPGARPGGQRAQLPKIAAGHVLVKIDPRADARRVFGLARAQGLAVKRGVYGTSWVRMAIPRGANPRTAAARARRLPGVLAAAADPIVRINDTIPNDPFFKDDPDPSDEPCDPIEEECDPMEFVDQWGLFKVGAPAAWDNQRGSPQVVIAITDSGVDLDHDDLYGNIWVNPADPPDGRDNDRNGFVDDVHGADFCGDNVGDPGSDDPDSQDSDPDIPGGGDWVEDENAFPFGVYFDGDPAVGDAIDNDGDGWSIDGGVFHGTFVAGIAGAMTDNVNPQNGQYEGMAGTAWNCRLMAVRIINAEGWGFGSDAAAAIRYATDMGADVINCSWGIGVDTNDPEVLAEIEVIAEAVRYAAHRDVIIVAAAGNSSRLDEVITGLDFPGLMPEAISVGSSNWLDQRSEFSSTALPREIPDNGRDDDRNGWVDDVLDVVAPGEVIWSTYTLSAYDALLFAFLGMENAEPGMPTYFVSDGTSFSTPLVSGYVGLILSSNPGADLNRVRHIIRSNALDIRDPNGQGQNLPGYDIYSGFGRVRMVVGPGGPDTNRPPVLAVTGEPGYQTDGVEPNTGTRSRRFQFRVRYSDADGDKADYVRVRIFNSQGQEASRSPVAMTPISGGGPRGGITYRALARLEPGTYTHYFEATDGRASVRLLSASSYPGPTVSGRRSPR